MWKWVIIGVFLLTLIFVLLGCRRVKVYRQISPEEGIEDTEVVKAYDRISRWPQFKILRRIIVGELKRYHPEGILADIGSGPGYLIENLSKSFPHLSIIGVDVSRGMLKKASENVLRQGLGDRVSFRHGDIQGLPFDNNSLDFIVSTLSLHHWAEPVKAIQEIDRVLKHGGQFLIFDLRRDSPRLFYWLIRFAQRFVLPYPMKRINEPTSSALASYTPSEVRSLLLNTSFEKWKIKSGFFWIFVWGCKE